MYTDMRETKEMELNTSGRDTTGGGKQKEEWIKIIWDHKVLQLIENHFECDTIYFTCPELEDMNE